MEAFIWVVVVIICIITVVLTLITSVTKWSNKAVDKYVKEDDPTRKDIVKKEIDTK